MLSRDTLLILIPVPSSFRQILRSLFQQRKQASSTRQLIGSLMRKQRLAMLRHLMTPKTRLFTLFTRYRSHSRIRKRYIPFVKSSLCLTVLTHQHPMLSLQMNSLSRQGRRHRKSSTNITTVQRPRLNLQSLQKSIQRIPSLHQAVHRVITVAFMQEFSRALWFKALTIGLWTAQENTATPE